MRGIKVTDPSVAVRLYYANITLDKADINELFGRADDPMSSSTLWKLRNQVKQFLLDNPGHQKHNPTHYGVNTAAAFAAWGLDIEDLERRHKKLMANKFVRPEATT